MHCPPRGRRSERKAWLDGFGVAESERLIIKQAVGVKVDPTPSGAMTGIEPRLSSGRLHERHFTKNITVTSFACCGS
ncbi:hypothetical protein BJF84_19740 [Rhodococcus sp. CUA-806]|nr:hypothetical protein BJF84_19740 [Rhodococcus sp. CUA-806]